MADTHTIGNDEKISFTQFAAYVQDEKNKILLKRKWNHKTKAKVFMSELESHELSDILVLFLKEYIKSQSVELKIESAALQDTSHLLSDWIFENKLSGIPGNDEEDYNQQKLADIFDKSILFEWISECALPLETYVRSQSQDVEDGERGARNKKMIAKHPSLAHLFTEQIVNKKQRRFNDYKNILKVQDDEAFNQKQDDATQNIHQLRQSRAMLFFNHSEIGYETKRKCNVYKDRKLTKFLIEVEKGELFGGKTQKIDNKIVEIIEPIKGFIHSKYLKEFALDSAQWKFLQHQRSMTSTGSAQPSLILRIKNEELFLGSAQPAQEDQEQEDEDEDEKKLEESSVKQRSESVVSRVLNMEKQDRSARDVVDLWSAGFNLHNCEILKECYALKVTSTQFVNQELNERDPVLQCLKQMFEASNDVGVDVTNIILKGATAIMEFRTFGTRKEAPHSQDTTSANHVSNNTHLLASHPTKDGLPQKVINGVGIFEVKRGEIVSQKLFWDQDQQWFSDMNVIKMPQSSTLSHFLYKNKLQLAPILNLNESISSSHSMANGSEPMVNAQAYGAYDNEVTANGDKSDNRVIYEMNDQVSEILALRGLNINDLREYHPNQRNKQKQFAQAMFWIAVGAMFVFIVPKFLGKPKR